ncbi:hypothetical protein [Pseudomonas antarctica]|uniref:hypothetical protein n=1 Tax=Pseudomonas antarctica TaxID=219572 RepID=UPI00345CADD9
MSNFGAWQINKVSLRFNRVEESLKIIKRYKSKIERPTELCVLVAERVSFLELEDWARGARKAIKPKPFTPETLLKRNGPYRVLIDSYFFDVQGVGSNVVKLLKEPVAKRIVEMKDVVIGRHEAKIAELNNVLESLRESMKAKTGVISTSVEQEESSAYDSMAFCANAFFELLLSTGYVNFDEVRGEILQVSRARKVILDSRQIGAFLNWRASNI